MKYAAILKSELDWKCALVNSEGKVFFKEISEWGLMPLNEAKFDADEIEPNTSLMTPLDYLRKSISSLPNYLCIINPNQEIDTQHLEFLARRKMQLLRAK
jgi:hypothetical protein